MLIVLCGIDGAGKTTLGGLLAQWLSGELSHNGYHSRVLFTKLVGSGSEFVRYFKLLLQIDPNFDERSQNYVFAFERVRTANETLRKLLETNDAVVLDRYVHCDIAMSRARAREDRMFHMVLEHVPVPELGFVIDVPVDLALRRIESRQTTPWSFQENEVIMKAARREYLRVAEEFHFPIIDASGTPESALHQMSAEINRRELFPSPWRKPL